MLFTLLPFCVVTLGQPGGVAAAPVGSRGAALAYACAACHGPDGRSQGAIPSLHTLSAAEIRTALREFRAGSRPGTIMPRLAKGLDDADVDAVAAYFASLPQQ